MTTKDFAVKLRIPFKDYGDRNLCKTRASSK